MESVNVDRLVRPGSRLPSQEEDDDLQILDPAKHAELVRYRVLSGEDFAPYIYVQLQSQAFEYMMTQVAARRRTIVRLLVFRYGPVEIRENDTPRQV